MPGGDALFTDDLQSDASTPTDACGVFGVWVPGEEVAKLTYFGLYALQHRGQESAGIAASNGRQILVYKDMGLVSQVFDEPILNSLRGNLAVGHCRYSTTGSSVWDNAQPTFRSTAMGGLALGHNGNLINTGELAEHAAESATGNELFETPQDVGGVRASSDTGLLTSLLAAHSDRSLFDAAVSVLPKARGAFSLVFCDEATVYAARDPQGIHPLVLGQFNADGGPRGWVVASETAALDIVGATFVREVDPGELIAFGQNGLRSARFATAEPKGCLFEFVYLARPDTTISGRSVHTSRVEVGRRLAREHPAEADLVIPVPESATPAAIGYAEASGISYGHGLVKNSYVGRTFIQPSQTIRQLGVRLKYNPLREVIAGKRLVVVDDSIVRGNTQRALVQMLREAGAAEIHVRISSPPVRWPCFYGVDFASSNELAAANLDVDGIRDRIDADSLGYVSLEELIAASTIEKTRLCRACFDGVYPIGRPDSDELDASGELDAGDPDSKGLADSEWSDSAGTHDRQLEDRQPALSLRRSS